MEGYHGHLPEHCTCADWTPAVQYYHSREDEILETSPDLVIPGEDPEETLFGGLGDDEDKPVRLLGDFCVFDPMRKCELVSLDALEDGNGNERLRLEAAGYVMAAVANEEDAGQEDEGEDEDALAYVRLGPILRIRVDYAQQNE